MTSVLPAVLGDMGPQQWFWFRHNAGTFGDRVDPVYFFVFWVSAFFFVVLMALMAYFGIKYRRRVGVAAEPSASHNTLLELTWSVVPTLIMAVMFYWGFKEYLHTRIAPADSETIYVTGQKWFWRLEYPGGIVSSESESIADMKVSVFAIPVDRPVNFIMTSSDVIHSFYIPAFRTKRDLFPNRYSNMWIQALDKPTHTMKEEPPGSGQWKSTPIDPANPGYYLFCAEYCGDQHSQMGGRIAIMSGTDYKKWLAAQADTGGIPLLQLGEMIWEGKGGCNQCHSVDGSKKTGPTWKNIWGETHEFQDGSKFAVDLNYVRESILVPSVHVRTGYSNQMPSFQGKLNEREIRAIAVYITSLSDAHKDDAVKESDAEMAEKKAKAAGAETPAK